MAEETILDEAIARIDDEALRQRITREVELLRGSRRFGLVFDRHLPESVRLSDHPIRKGVKVGLRDESSTDTWRVIGFTDQTRQTAILSDDTAHPVTELVVVREFGETVFPGLVPVDRLPHGADEAPWHTVINGENFHVLQALRSTHKGKVDLIYIDPPYNTGQADWIYNDRHVDASDRAKSSKWLSFLERRLLIARDLLKRSGVFIAAIGDDEHHRLRMLLDQVFGAENFIMNVTWQGGGSAVARHHAGGADYMLIYARDIALVPRFLDPKPFVTEMLRIVSEAMGGEGLSAAEAQTRLRAFIKSNQKKMPEGVTRFNNVDDKGVIFETADLTNQLHRPNLRYPVVDPATGRVYEPPATGWTVRRELMDELVADGLVIFGKSPRRKKSLADYTSAMPLPTFTKSRITGNAHLVKVLGDKRFPFPKDHEVLMRWIRMACPPDGLILDYFGGSGTTTEAVLRLNAEDGGTRQSILVTNNEVGVKQAKALRKDGHHPGDLEWDAMGVFEYVTRPRISTVVTGKRPDGSDFSDGLSANVEFLKLSYLDPGMVRRGREFEAIAPLLWLEAGATGDRISEEPEAGWALTDHYGVLFTVDAMAPFATAVSEAAQTDRPPAVVFIVTDSPTEFQAAAERLPVGIDTVRLYESYLANYTINVTGGAR